VSGFQEVIPEYLKTKLPDVKIRLVLDGLILYSTNEPAETIKKLRPFTNTFLCLKEFKNLGNHPMRQMTSMVLNDKKIFNHLKRSFRSNDHTEFRVVYSLYNQPVSLNDQTMRSNLEKMIAHATGAVPNRVKPSIELLVFIPKGRDWFLFKKNDETLH
jgi:hypothetical protein